MGEDEKSAKKRRDKERKDQDLHLRATRSQMQFLDMLSYENEKTKTEMIWKALEFYHNCNKAGF